MPYNPMKTRKEWQVTKKKFGIPDKVIKNGSFGDKMEKLQKKFVSLGLGSITEKNAKGGLDFAQEADVLLDEWLTAAQKRKATDFKDRAGALKEVGDYKSGVRIVREMSEAKLNPIAMSKKNFKKFQVLWAEAVDDPADAGKLHQMYSQGIRNYIGQGFHDAYKMRDTLNLPTALAAKIAEYEKIAAKWNHLQDSAQVLADDAAMRAKFWKDMQKLAGLGLQIIKLGA